MKSRERRDTTPYHKTLVSQGGWGKASKGDYSITLSLRVIEQREVRRQFHCREVGEEIVNP